MVILKSLEALERSDLAGKIGWEVLINADEEVGSEGSSPFLNEAAEQNHVGLVFEPSTTEEGVFAGERKGTGNFTAVVSGVSAHAGREFHAGRNAICAAAVLASDLNRLNGQRDGVTINIGKIHGGGPLNVVPDTCVCQLNVRTVQSIDEEWFEEQRAIITEKLCQKDGITVRWHGRFTRKPKRMSQSLQKMFQILEECGEKLGVVVRHQSTGGCCDGNNLAAAGLPNIDTLGVRGGKIHSDQEYIKLDSLVERTKLTYLFLMRLASDPNASSYFDRKH